MKNSPDSDSGCVYAIPCNTRNKTYIGQIGKSVQTLTKHHKYSVRCAQESSAVFFTFTPLPSTILPFTK